MLMPTVAGICNEIEYMLTPCKLNSKESRIFKTRSKDEFLKGDKTITAKKIDCGFTTLLEETLSKKRHRNYGIYVS